MNLTVDRFLSGPNLYAAQSGLLLELHLDDEDGRRFDWRPGAGERDTLLERLHSLFPETVDAAELAGGDGFPTAARPAVALSLALAAALMRECNVRPAVGREVEEIAERRLLFVPCDQANIGLQAAHLALSTVSALLADPGECVQGAGGAALRRQHWIFRTSAQREGLNRTSLALARAARRRGIPYSRIAAPGPFLHLGQGVRGRRLHETTTDGTGAVAARLQGDELATAAFLATHGVPTPKPRSAGSPAEAVQVARRLGYPVLVRSCASGTGARVALQDDAAVAQAFHTATRNGKGAVVERFVTGAVHQLLVIGGRLAGAVCEGATGDVTDAVHRDNRLLVERIARLLGLEVAGIRLVSADIRRSWRDAPGAVVGVEAAPDLQPYQAAAPWRDLAGRLIDHLFPAEPDGRAGRIPIAGITGSAGKTTTCRMVAAMLAEQGRRVALSTTLGAWIGEEAIRLGDVAGGGMAQRLLQDPGVEAGVFELARGGLIKAGMTLDGVDVGAVLNVQDQHVGIDGVSNRADLARVKRLVVDNARRMAVLNADDPLCLAMRSGTAVHRTCLVTLREGHPEVTAHLAAGGTAACLGGAMEGGRLRLLEGAREVLSLPVAAIPAAWNGAHVPAVHNALFAMAIAHGMGVDTGAIQRTLECFQSTYASNPGRMNFMPGLPFELLVTWCDGPVPMAELASFVRSRKVRGMRRIVISAMGNRPDTYLRATGCELAGSFDHYICSDWEDLRGRGAGEVAGLLRQGLLDRAVPGEAITVVPAHDEALQAAYTTAVEGDLLVVVTFSSRKAWELARAGRPV